MKLIASGSIAVLLLLMISCGASEPVKVNPQDIISRSYAVGDTAHGGIVFLVNSDGTHGLVAASQDQLVNSHYQDAYDLVNDPRFHDKSGQQYFDWRLPKLWEAYKMYMNLHLINLGGFSGSGYWTSESGASYDQKHVLNFSKGVDHVANKADTYRVRAVRTF